MKGFEDVTLSWAGKDYVVPADRQLMLIAEIEDALSGPNNVPAVAVLTRPAGPGHARLASAYGAALQYAGAEVSEGEIYMALQEDMADGNAGVQVKLQNATLGLLAIVSPPVYSRLMALGDTVEPGKPEAPPEA